MILLHNIGLRHNSNYNTPDEIAASQGPLSFDGVYYNVYTNRHLLKDRDVTLFIMGNYIGKDNAFDRGQLPETFCDWKEILELKECYGVKLGWHTWTHRNLCWLTDDEVRREITPPFEMDYFAYPYGVCDARVADLVAAQGYKEAWSVTQGDGSQFQRKRRYLNW